MILLTDEENIVQVPDICYLVKDSKGFRILRKSNKAQLRRMERWLCEEFEYLTMSAETLKLLNDIRQALLKEVGE